MTKFSRSKTARSLPNVTAFCIANVAVDPQGRTPTADLFESYLQWFPSFVGGSQKASRRVFTAAVQEVMANNGFPVTYGPACYGGKTVRCFTGLRISESGLTGAAAVARDLLEQSAARRADDPTYASAVRSVVGLLPSYAVLQWSKAAVTALLDGYVDVYPELETVRSLL